MGATRYLTMINGIRATRKLAAIELDRFAEYNLAGCGLQSRVMMNDESTRVQGGTTDAELRPSN